MLAMTSGTALWYLTRGSGMVALLLLTAAVVMGIVQSVRWSSPRWPRFVIGLLHRNVSLLVTVFLALHIAASIIDGFAPIRWLDAIVPFAGTYRPLWLGFGALSLDLILALVITSLLRQRLGHQAWRAIHWTAYACWPVAVLHGLGTGTDTRARWAQLVTAGCGTAVLGALAWRVGRSAPGHPGRRSLAGAGGYASVAAIAVWTLVGPLRPGWAARAGTPANLLGGGGSAAHPAANDAAAGGAGSGVSAGPAALTVPFTAAISGALRQDGPDSAGRTTVTVTGTLSDGAEGTVEIDLVGRALGGGGVQMSSGTATIAAPGGSPSLQGRVVSLERNRIEVAATAADGSPVTLTIRLRIDRQTSQVTGDVSANGGAPDAEGPGDHDG
jgi:sulfoxide reductase heme-binding subunit YedZ